MDAATAGGPARGKRDSGEHQQGDGAPGAEKTQLKPWLKECWCIPPKASAEFVCAMEDVLEVYHRQFEDNEVLVCLDETSKQLVRETCTPLPPRPGAPAWLRLRIRAQRRGQPFHAVCALGGMAAGGGHGAPHQDRLGGGGAQAGGGAEPLIVRLRCIPCASGSNVDCFPTEYRRRSLRTLHATKTNTTSAARFMRLFQ